MTSELEEARLRRCPGEWPVYPLKYLAQLHGGGTPSKDREDFWTDGTVPWVSPKDMKRRVIDRTEDYITPAAVRESATSYVEPGSVLVVVRSGILRHSLPVAIAHTRVTLNQDMKAFSLDERVSPGFFAYWIEGQGSELLLEWRQFGATVDNIDVPRMMKGRIALPDLATQSRIADFLDRETVRIDQLIEKKQRLVELVMEHDSSELDALTFGAVEQSGWQKIPFKWVCRIPNGQVDPTEEPWVDMPLIAPNHIESGTGRLIQHESARDQGAISGKYSFPAGTVLYSKIRPALAKACIAPVDGLCSADMYPIIPSSRLLPAYLLMQLLSNAFTDWAVLESMRVAMPKINRETLGTINLVIPPLGTQQQLIDRWSHRKVVSEAVIDKTRESIEALQEFRSALITAAVTGQIDVDSWSRRGSTDQRLEKIEEEMRV